MKPALRLKNLISPPDITSRRGCEVLQAFGLQDDVRVAYAFGLQGDVRVAYAFGLQDDVRVAYAFGLQDDVRVAYAFGLRRYSFDAFASPMPWRRK